MRKPKMMSKFLLPMLGMLLLTGGCSDDDDNPVRPVDELPEAVGWQWQNPYPTYVSLAAVHFANNESGWVFGRRGFILHTEDGGNTWLPQESNVEADIRAAMFVDAQTGWAVTRNTGEGCTVIHTNDGGLTWINQRPENGARILTDLSFVDSRHGWVVGWDGVILRTADGGTSWELLNHPADEYQHHFQGVFFLDSLRGWVPGSNGNVLRTVDGGDTWIHDGNLNQGGLDDVVILNDTIGWGFAIP